MQWMFFRKPYYFTTSLKEAGYATFFGVITGGIFGRVTGRFTKSYKYKVKGSGTYPSDLWPEWKDIQQFTSKTALAAYSFCGFIEAFMSELGITVVNGEFVDQIQE